MKVASQVKGAMIGKALLAVENVGTNNVSAAIVGSAVSKRWRYAGPSSFCQRWTNNEPAGRALITLGTACPRKMNSQVQPKAMAFSKYMTGRVGATPSHSSVAVIAQ